MASTLYIFLDEGGNFDFSPTGSKYFSLSCVTMERPFKIHTELDTYKYNLMEYGLDQEYFHCTDDNQHVRNQIFNIINANNASIRIDSILVDKAKAHPTLRDDKHFYPKILGFLLKYVFEKVISSKFEEIIVITDAIPVNKKRKAIEKGVKKILSEMLPKDSKYRIYHHSSKGHYSLQVADYCNWAIYRKWERNDRKYYDLIAPSIKSEFDIFQNGQH